MIPRARTSPSSRAVFSPVIRRNARRGTCRGRKRDLAIGGMEFTIHGVPEVPAVITLRFHFSGRGQYERDAKGCSAFQTRSCSASMVRHEQHAGKIGSRDVLGGKHAPFPPE